MRHIYQLTGFSDPIYAEASVTVHDYEMTIDMLVVNRTPNTLPNLTVELATMGDIELLERDPCRTMGPRDECHFLFHIRVSSTEEGYIFGTIVFDNAVPAQKTYVNLNELKLNLMDYFLPCECNHRELLNMWWMSEWENKIRVNTTTTNKHNFLRHIIATTKMTHLDPIDDLSAVRTRSYFRAFTLLCLYLFSINLFAFDNRARILLFSSPTSTRGPCSAKMSS